MSDAWGVSPESTPGVQRKLRSVREEDNWAKPELLMWFTTHLGTISAETLINAVADPASTGEERTARMTMVNQRALLTLHQ